VTDVAVPSSSRKRAIEPDDATKREWRANGDVRGWLS
jgi:hypothetical protein